MIALDPSSRYVFIPFEVGTGGGLGRYDRSTGDFVAALTGNATGVFSTDPFTWDPNNDDFGACDPAEWTPNGTVLTAEEWSGSGRVFEWMNPLMAPGDAPQVRWLPVPSVAHEGLKFGADGTLYFIDERSSGSIYRYVPVDPADLGAGGQTFVLSDDDFVAAGGVSGENWNSAANSSTDRTGSATWVAITDASGNALPGIPDPFVYGRSNDVSRGGQLVANDPSVNGTPYGRPEDLEISTLASGNEVVFVAATSEQSIYSIELIDTNTAYVQKFASRDTIDAAHGVALGTELTSPDNLAIGPNGEIYVIEDQSTGGDIWAATDANDDGVAESMGRIASLGIPGNEEPTGWILDRNDADTFLVCIQHPSSGNDALWAVTTPWDLDNDNVIDPNDICPVSDLSPTVIATTPGTRILDAVSVRGDSVTGAGGTILNINRAYLNNAGTVVFSSTLSGAGVNNQVVARGPIAGPYTAIAVKDTASGVGNFGAFSDLTMNDSGNAGFASRVVPNNPGHFLNASGAAANTSNTAVKGAIAAPVAGNPLYRSLQKPAITSGGQLLTRANLVIGSGAGVTSGDDTVITSSAGTVLAREGDATSIGGGVLYSGLNNRIVASEDNNRYAFSSALKPVSSLINTGLFAGTIGGGTPTLIAREGDSASGTGGGVFASFLGESVNSDGVTAFRGTARGGSVTSSNNEGIWTTSGGGAPVLVAREGGIAPCLPVGILGLVAFDRFTTLAISDDGSVCFFAYLKNSAPTPAVNSTNDGSIWRRDGAGLHLIAREGDLANNTDGAGIGRLTGFACSGAGGVVYSVEYTRTQGDYTSANRDGIYVDRGVLDGAPELILRRGDTFDLMGTEHTVSSLKINFEENTGHGIGGYGRSINDMGSVLLNLSLSGNLSGIFLINPGP